jgi:hypothetical protein
MKHITHEPTGLHVTYEIADYLDELDDKAHRRQKRIFGQGKLIIPRVVFCMVSGLVAATVIYNSGMAIAAKAYEFYLYLFPQR